MSYSTRDVQRELRRRLGRDGYRAMTTRIRRDNYREERRRNAVPAPLTPWGEKYYKFWFDTGVLMRQRPEAFRIWTNSPHLRRTELSARGVESRRMFEIMWNNIIVGAPPWFRARFDVNGVAKDHAWLKFAEGWRQAFDLEGFGVRQRGITDGPEDLQSYVNRFNRLCYTYVDLAHGNTERARYRRMRR